MKNLLIQGDSRHLPLPDRSVHCIVTSPPYWSLRDYGLPPSIWGGDPECDHSLVPTAMAGGCGNSLSYRRDRAAGRERGGLQPGTCVKCGAWVGCLGLEPTPTLYVAHMVEVFRECRRVLRDDGTVWLNIGDSYAVSGRGGGGGSFQDGDVGRKVSRENSRRTPAEGFKAKDIVGIPWLLAFALRADGWFLRQEIIWHKPNPMPSSVTDRCTTAHESVFLLTKNAKYFYDADAIREPVTSTGGASVGKQDHSTVGTGAQSRRFTSPEDRNHPLGRNKRSVWKISTQSFKDAHFATFPVKLVLPMIKAGTSERGVCAACGAPWKRIVERITEFRSGSGAAGNLPKGKGRPDGDSQVRDGHDLRMGNTNRTITTHWLPTCKCPATGPIPATVLDPFSGAATTGIACLELGRNYVGVEPKFQYIEIARKRLADWKPKCERPVRPREKPQPAQMSLFGGK